MNDIAFTDKKNNYYAFDYETGEQLTFKTKGMPQKITIDEVEIPFLNTSTWVAGRFRWDAIDVTLRDPIGPSASQAIMEWVRLHAESVTGRMGYSAGYKKNVTLEMLDPTGVVIERWKLVNTMLTSSDFGTLDYNSGDLIDITINMRFDRAILVF
jgi:hypothetical protein